MRRPWLHAWPLLAALGCASSSIGADVERVQRLTRTEHLAKVADGDVDPDTAAEARRLLQQPLDVDGAVRVALLNNRELRATLREMGVARGQMIQAGLLPNPRAEAEWLPERNSGLSLRVEYDLTRAVLAPSRSRAAAPELEAARYRGAEAVLELAYRTRVAFYRLQAAQQRRAAATQLLEGAAASREAAQAMFAAGNVAALDVASEEAAHERARIRVAELELEVATERERVQRLLGAQGGEETTWSVRGELPPVPEQPIADGDLENRALRASLELMESRQHLVALGRRAGLTRTEGWLPDAIVDVHALHGTGGATAQGPADRNLRFGAGVNVGIPLFDRNQGTAAALEAQFDAEKERYYGAAIDIRSAARETRNRVSSAHTRARQYQEVIVPAQRRVTEQSLLQYNAMQLGIFQLLQARREQLDVQLAYVETLREYWSAAAELDALLAGMRVAGDVQTEHAGVASQTDAAGGY